MDSSRWCCANTGGVDYRLPVMSTNFVKVCGYHALFLHHAVPSSKGDAIQYEAKRFLCELLGLGFRGKEEATL